MIRYPITPVPKPKQTRSDKWKKRPSVVRYRAFADLVRHYKVDLPLSGAQVIFIIPIPKSWSKQRKEVMRLQAHEQTPNIDNLFKALADAVYKNDSKISDIRITKIWGDQGEIIIL